MTAKEGQVYFDTRIRGSSIGTWASPQSQVLEGRERLEKGVADVEKQFEGGEKPPFPSSGEVWGLYQTGSSPGRAGKADCMTALFTARKRKAKQHWVEGGRLNGWLHRIGLHRLILSSRHKRMHCAFLAALNIMLCYSNFVMVVGPCRHLQSIKPNSECDYHTSYAIPTYAWVKV